jgi:hypothetical protein
MSFVLVTADFPEILSEEISEIFNRLEEQNWIKLHDHQLPVNTIWFNTVMTGKVEDAIKAARHNFTACCIPICIPKLALEWGTSDEHYLARV